MLRYFEILPLAIGGEREILAEKKTFQMRLSFYLAFWVSSKTIMVMC